MVREFFSWLWCVMFHRWVRHHRVRHASCELDRETEEVCYCSTCGRDR